MLYVALNLRCEDFQGGLIARRHFGIAELEGSYAVSPADEGSPPGESGAEGGRQHIVSGFNSVFFQCFSECYRNRAGRSVAVLVHIGEHFIRRDAYTLGKGIKLVWTFLKRLALA